MARKFSGIDHLKRDLDIEVLAEPERVLSTFIKGYLNMPVRIRN